MSLNKIPVIKVVAISQAQKVMDLDSGSEDAQITVKQNRYFAPTYDEKEFGGTEAEFQSAVLEAAKELVNPVEKQIDALLYRATQDSYQSGKAAALAGGNYLSSDLKGKIVQVMRGNQAFVDVSASDCFAKWKAGYMAKKPGAFNILTTAQNLGVFDDIE